MLIPKNIILEQQDKNVTIAVDYDSQQVTLGFTLRRSDGENGVLTISPDRQSPLLVQGVERADVLNGVRDWEHALAKENVALTGQVTYLQAALSELQAKLVALQEQLDAATRKEG